MSDPRGASLVVPNYNGRALLEQNVPSLLAAADAYPGEAEVVIVDDASADDSVAFLRDAFPAVRVLEHAENQGFGGACHSGVAAAAWAAGTARIRCRSFFTKPAARSRTAE